MQLVNDPAWTQEQIDANEAALQDWLDSHPPRVIEMRDDGARLEFTLPGRVEVVDLPHKSAGCGSVSVGGAVAEGGGPARATRKGTAALVITKFGATGTVIATAIVAPESYRLVEFGDVELLEEIVIRVTESGSIGRIQLSTDEDGIFFTGDLAICGCDVVAKGQIIQMQPQILRSPTVKAEKRALAAADKLAGAIRAGTPLDEALAAYERERRMR